MIWPAHAAPARRRGPFRPAEHAMACGCTARQGARDLATVDPRWVGRLMWMVASPGADGGWRAVVDWTTTDPDVVIRPPSNTGLDVLACTTHRDVLAVRSDGDHTGPRPSN